MVPISDIKRWRDLAAGASIYSQIIKGLEPHQFDQGRYKINQIEIYSKAQEKRRLRARSRFKVDMGSTQSKVVTGLKYSRRD